MFLLHFLFALIIASVLAAIFGVGFRRHRWGMDLWLFFLLLFLFTWVGGVWVTPFGPAIWGVPLFSFLLAGLLFVLLLAALIPSPRETRRPVGMETLEEERQPAIGINVFFWILLIGLITAIIVAYF